MASKKAQEDERCYANPYLKVATCRLPSTKSKGWRETVRTKAEVDLSSIKSFTVVCSQIILCPPPGSPRSAGKTGTGDQNQPFAG